MRHGADETRVFADIPVMKAAISADEFIAEGRKIVRKVFCVYVVYKRCAAGFAERCRI